MTAAVATNPITEPVPRRESSAAQAEALNVDAALGRISEVTGAGLAERRTVQRGASANPARRLAVIVLATRPDLTHRAVAGLLAMSVRQVANVLYDLRRKPLPVQIAAWEDRWNEMIDADQDR